MADEPSSENGGDADKPPSKGSSARRGDRDRPGASSEDALRAAALKAVENEKKGVTSERPKAPAASAPAVGTLSGKKAAERVEIEDDSRSSRIWIAVGLVVGVLFLAGVALAVLSGGEAEHREGDAINTEGRIEVRQITTTSSAPPTTRSSTTTTTERSTTTTGDSSPTTGGARRRPPAAATVVDRATEEAGYPHPHPRRPTLPRWRSRHPTPWSCAAARTSPPW